MGDTLPERVRFAPLGIHVMGVIIAAVTGVHDYVGFGDGAPGGDSHAADLVVLEKLADFHEPPSPVA
jgi:hypothetical protein